MEDSEQKALILIVDDDVLNLEVLDNIVTKSGYRSATTQSGQQALEYLTQHRPDLILLDVMMPEMDGLEVCRQAKKHDMGRDIPVIFITALSETEDIVRAFEAGGVDFITKPFVVDEVQARIKVHTQLKRAMEKLANMSVTDEMTGVFNRRHAYEIMAREMSFAKRENTTFVLCFIDIDNLKTINDTFGHEAGDELINTVVTGFKHSIRATDYLFRMGGDEFLLLLPKASVEDARIKIERLRQEMNLKKVRGIPIDFCFGFSMFSPDNIFRAEELIKKADSSMYDQKMQKKKNKNNASLS